MNTERRQASPVALLYLRQMFLSFVMLDLSGCAVTRIEDVMGPSALLAQPPQDLVVPAAPGQVGPSNPIMAASEPDEESGDGPLQIEVPSGEPVPPVLSAQENNAKFGNEAQWHAYHSPEGYDATDASGTLCAGNLVGNSPEMTRGLKIPMACSDGKTALLLVETLAGDGGTGFIVIDKNKQTVRIANIAPSQ